MNLISNQQTASRSFLLRTSQACVSIFAGSLSYNRRRQVCRMIRLPFELGSPVSQACLHLDKPVSSLILPLILSSSLNHGTPHYALRLVVHSSLSYTGFQCAAFPFS